MIDFGYGVSLGDIPKQAREWRNEPRIRDWCREVDHIRPEHHEDWLRGNRDRMYGIYADGNPVGVCGLTGIRPPHNSAETSLYIAEGNYGLPAMQTLLKHGFDGLGLHRIWSEIFEGNEVAIKLAQLLGFLHEGTLKQSYWKNGRWIDSHIYALLREEWKNE